MAESVKKVTEIVRPIVEAHGMELVDVTFKKIGGQPSLTVTVDKEGGVRLSDCETIHNAIDAPLDELDPTNGAAYTLNVSSPGIDRPFTRDKDFLRHIGHEVEVSLYRPVEGLKKFEAILREYDGTSVTVEPQGKKGIQIQLKDVAVIRAVVKF